MRFLHTMIRVANLEKSLHFYQECLGFRVVKKKEYAKENCTLVFLQASEDASRPDADERPMIELTYNWGAQAYQKGDAFGHLAFEVPSVEELQKKLKSHGYDFSWGPGRTPSGKSAMAFIDDPDGYEIEILEAHEG